MPRRAGTASRRGLTHLSPRGDARMVDVSAKPETAREAIASAVLRMSPKTLAIVRAGNAPKGDVLGVARTAGILAAKRTHELIPLCHPLRLTGIDVTFSDDDRGVLTIETRVRTVDKTGVEMEALMAASIDRKSTRLNSSHITISYAVFCLKKKKRHRKDEITDSRRAQL